jgi:hypothetical protein
MLVAKKVGRSNASIVEAQIDVLNGQGMLAEVEFGRKVELSSAGSISAKETET